MAQDLFAPKAAFDIGYEQPIEPAVDNTEKIRTDFERMALQSEAKAIRAEAAVESAEFAKKEALVNILGQGLKAYGSYARTSEAARKRQATGDLFQGLDDLQAQREEGNITETDYEIQEDRLLKGAIRSGLDLDSLKTELEIYTNKPIAMLGKSQGDYLATQMRNDPRFVVYANASRVTNPDLTDADHENYAFQQIQLEDRNLSIAQVADSRRKATKGAAYINFDTEFKPAIDDRYNRLQSSILATVETSSGNIDRKGLRDMLGVIKAENALLLNEKAYLGVSDEDFQPVLDRIQALEKFIQTTLDSNTPEVYWDDFRGAIADAARAGGNPDMLMGSILMTDVPTVMSAYGVGRSTELLSNIMNSDASKQYFTPISNGETLREITDATTETVTPNTVLTDDQLPDAFKIPEDQQRSVTKSNYESGIFLLQTMDPNGLQEETFRKQFVTGATNVVRAMNTPDVAMSKQYITEAIVSTNMADKLDKLEIYDKTSADTLRIGIRSQLQHQINVNRVYLDNIENSAAVLNGYPVRLSWDSEEQAYYITGTEGNPRGILRDIKEKDPSYYKANFVEGKGIKADMSNYLFKNSVVTKALNARESIDFINNQMEVFKKDGVEEPVTTTTPAMTTSATEPLEILSFISSGEGGYESSNRGTEGDNIIGSTNSTTRDNKSLSELTLGEIKSYQNLPKNDPNRLFAVGAYQITPVAMDAAMKAAGVNDNTIFSADVQDRMGLGLLLGTKRPKLAAYIKGESNDINAAMLEFSKEFASIPNPSTGRSFYYKTGNKAQHTVEETRQALERAREAYSSGIMSEVIPTEGEISNAEVRNVALQAIEEGVEPTTSPSPQLRPGSMNVTQADWWTEEQEVKVNNLLKSGGFEGLTAADIKYFNTEAELDEAEKLGTVKKDEVVFIGREVFRVK